MNSNIENFKNEELLLYITSKLKDSPNFGSILLNKALYYIDNIHYLKYGTPISSFKYIKQENGPTPAPEIFMPIREKMIEEGKLEMKEIEKFGKIQKRLIAKKSYNLDSFSPNEVELMDMVIDDCKDLTASKISNISHNEMAWQLAELFEPLPLFTYLLTQSEIEEEDITWANEIIKKYESAAHN